ncbi:MAG: putative selenium-dependent hydroxylase accessory protein YqeC [Oscillospiraceae bacterium]|nr:putative selenium-dependent hydroxylase accessory protein YqeC [Oscillospiraceae bacterium]
MSSIIWANPEATPSLYRVLFGTRVPHVIALVGAGGKTSAINTLAWEIRSAGYRVVVTTTTKMYPPVDGSLLARTTDQARSLLQKRGIAWAGALSGPQKLEGIPGSMPALVDMADFVLVEADGARKHPLKMTDPAFEPVIPAEAQAVVAVAGLDGIGRAVSDAVHRPELACQALGVTGKHAVTPEDVARLLELCYKPKFVLLNKAENQARRDAAYEIAAALPKARCLGLCLKDWGHAENR